MLIKKLIFSGVLMSFLAFAACKNEPAATDAAPATPEAGTEATTTPTTAAPAPAPAGAQLVVSLCRQKLHQCRLCLLVLLHLQVDLERSIRHMVSLDIVVRYQ